MLFSLHFGSSLLYSTMLDCSLFFHFYLASWTLGGLCIDDRHFWFFTGIPNPMDLLAYETLTIPHSQTDGMDMTRFNCHLCSACSTGFLLTANTKLSTDCRFSSSRGGDSRSLGRFAANYYTSKLCFTALTEPGSSITKRAKSFGNRDLFPFMGKTLKF